MNCPQCKRWMQLGLAILTTSFASAVQAAALEASPSTAAGGGEVRMAQIAPDATLDTPSVVTPDVPIHGDLADLIEGGAIRGSNLFHSFQEFNVNTGQRVYFDNPSGIENILSRVTGSNLSDIDGLLGVNGGANLFMLNPNGIIFGPNAQLDIRGSFLASTGDRFAFADGSEFSAVNPQAGALLSVSVPLGVQFNDRPRNDITNDGHLAVGAGQSLTLFGDTVLSSGSLTASGGAVEVLGNRVGLIEQAQVDVSSATAGGDVLIGGDYQGQGDSPTAARTFVDSGVTINADALIEGDGGRVIVWADELTGFYGQISAQGGAQAGDGGFVEVSGLGYLDFAGEVNTHALNGQSGSLLLDPANIIIAINTPPGFTPVEAADPALSADPLNRIFYEEAEDAGQNSHITPTTVVDLLGGNSLTLEATNTIAVNNDVAANSANDLTLQASRIEVNDSILRQSGGGNIVLDTQKTPDSSVSVNGNRGRVATTILSGANLEGGDVRIITHDLSIENGAVVTASTIGLGDSGRVVIDATGDIVVTGENSFLSSQVNDRATGNSGGIEIKTDNLSVSNGAELSASTFAQGNSGLIEIEATGDIVVNGENSFLSSQVNDGANGNSGGIEIKTDNLSVSNGAELSASTFGRGDSGQVRINASGDIVVDGNSSGIFSQVFSSFENQKFNSGGINITTHNLRVLDGAEVAASTFGRGDSGPVVIDATGDIEVNRVGDRFRSRIESEVGFFDVTDAIGNSGGIDITTRNLYVRNGGEISASTFAQGNSGSLKIEATGNIELDGRVFLGSQVRLADAVGNSEGVNITTHNLRVLNGAQLAASTFGQGNSGQVQINASGDIVVNGDDSFIASQVEDGAVGISGGIDIMTNNLSVLGGAEVAANTLGLGSSGQIQINATGDIKVDGDGSFLRSEVRPRAEGTSGGIDITTHNLRVLNDAEISASTFGRGDSGRVVIDARGDIEVNGTDSFLVSQVNRGAVGASGGVEITTHSLRVLNGAQLAASTFAEGNSGLVKITATGDIVVDGTDSFLSSQVNRGAVGASGGIEITTRNLSVLNGARLAARTFGQGEAGAIEIRSHNDADLNISLSTGSLITAQTASPGRSGGDLTVRADGTLTIQGAGRLTVESQSSNTGAAGNIDVSADIVFLKDGVELSAQTASAEDGGNIIFNVSDAIVMRRGSFINTEATNDNVGNAGSIFINTDFLVAPPDENNDIIANAVGGDGGRVEINATGILGFTIVEQTAEQLRDNPDDTRTLTELLREENRTNDLSASSEFGVQGQIILNTPDIDPDRGLTELPTDLADSANQIAAGCGLGNTVAQSEFFTSGRGGLPPSPGDAISAEAVTVPWVAYDDGSTAVVTPPPPGDDDTIVEAQSMVVGADGTVSFVTDVAAAGQRSGLPNLELCAAASRQ